MSTFSGIWVALVTPFRGGQVDLPALRSLATHLIDSGAAGLVVCGTSGEAAALDEQEQLAVLDAAVSYTHLTLPTTPYGEISVVAVSLKKKKEK